MIFRYDFGKKLDLSKFQQHSIHYITHLKQINYHLFVYNYKLIADVVKTELDPCYQITVSIYDVIRDADGDVTNSNAIMPLNDLRFKEIKEIVKIFPEDHCKGMFCSDNSNQISDKICNLLKVLSRINKLSLFI